MATAKEWGAPGRFGAVITAMATPFDADLNLDLDGAATLARWLVSQGNEALVLTGTTGEAPTTSDQEKLDLWAAVSEAVTVPVLVGCGTNDTAHSVSLAARARQVGASGVLAVAPYYNRPSQAGMVAHFRAVAEASGLPVLLYDIPVRTGRRIAFETLVKLISEVPNIVGVKDAAGDVAAAAKLVATLPHADLYSGDDSLTLPLLAVGAAGVIGVATHWAARTFAEMIGSFGKGDVQAAAAANARLLDSYAFESSEDAPNPVPTKVMLAALSLPGGPTRPPMGPVPPGLAERARSVLAGLGRV